MTGWLLSMALLGQEALSKKPLLSYDASPRQIYISCSLGLSGDRLIEERVSTQFKPNAPATCGGLATQVLVTLREKGERVELRSCPFGSAAFETNPMRAMQIAYIEYFEREAGALKEVKGVTAMFLAFRNKWPCIN